MCTAKKQFANFAPRQPKYKGNQGWNCKKASSGYFVNSDNGAQLNHFYTLLIRHHYQNLHNMWAA